MGVKITKIFKKCIFQFLTILGVQKPIKGASFCKNDYIGYLYTFKLPFSLSKFAPILAVFIVEYIKSCKFWVEDPIKITPWPPGVPSKIFFEKNAQNNILGKVNENGDNLSTYTHATYRKPQGRVNMKPPGLARVNFIPNAGCWVFDIFQKPKLDENLYFSIIFEKIQSFGPLVREYQNSDIHAKDIFYSNFARIFRKTLFFKCYFMSKGVKKLKN